GRISGFPTRSFDDLRVNIRKEFSEILRVLRPENRHNVAVGQDAVFEHAGYLPEIMHHKRESEAEGTKGSEGGIKPLLQRRSIKQMEKLVEDNLVRPTLPAFCAERRLKKQLKDQAPD